MSSETTPQKVALTDRQITQIVAGLMITILLGGLEQTIVAVALPLMSSDLSGVEYLAWVVSSYLIAVTVSTPIYGKLGDIYGRRIMMISAIFIFMAASIFCAVAPTMPLMILARVLQGIGGGGLLSVSQTIIGDVVSPRERGRYQGYISTAFALASVIGPAAGGLLTEYASWHWIFWINVPLCVLAYLISIRTLKHLPVPHMKRSVDAVGALLLMVGLTTLLIAISRIGHGVALSESTNVIMLSLSVVILAAFVWQEQRAKEPIIPLSLLRNRHVAASCALLFIAFVQLIGLSIFIPLRLQMLTTAGADGAAIQLLPMSIAIPFGAYIGGTLMTRMGRYRGIELVGAIIVPIFVMLTAYTPADADLLVILNTVLAGLGIGLQLPTATVAAQNAVARHHLGVVTAVASFSRSVGAAVGIAVLTAVLFALLQALVPQGQLSTSAADIVSEMVSGRMQGISAADQAVLVSGAAQAFRQVFSYSALFALLSIVVCLIVPEQKLSEKRPDHPSAHS